MRILFSCFAIACSSMALAWGVASLNGNNGIVALDGFSEGVVLCGEATIVNSGYEDDPRVQELLELAEDVCPQ